MKNLPISKARRKEREALVETLEIMSDQSLMASLRQSIKETKQGKLIPWERARNGI